MERFFNIESINCLGKEIKLCGWVESIRSHGKILFIDLRDKTGLMQVVFTPECKDYEESKKLRPEWVIEVIGKVNQRPDKMINPNIETGKVEVEANSLNVFSLAKTIPFGVDSNGYDINEELRLKYRYLDLRRQRMRKNLEYRQEVLSFIRNFLQKHRFVEIETPILTKSTPEGARDFLVPSRIQKGKFYALPQSPQQYKQLLMVAGLERYFQIARCFRDEDLRANRQAEFTQLDLEMSFVEEKDIISLTEDLFTQIVKNIFPNKKIATTPFPHMSYRDAMEKYNSDKPDLRKDKNDPNELAFLWVRNFPMFEWSENDKRWHAMHHPFTRPQETNIERIKKSPKTILAYQYDLVLNGEEIGGGSLRSYKKEILEAVFETMGHSKKQIQDKFGHILEAFEYGVPPHGGIAPGIDRFLSILLNEANIREVIAFPKTGDARDLMMNAPSEPDDDQLKTLGIKIK